MQDTEKLFIVMEYADGGDLVRASGMMVLLLRPDCLTGCTLPVGQDHQEAEEEWQRTPLAGGSGGLLLSAMPRPQTYSRPEDHTQVSFRAFFPLPFLSFVFFLVR